MIKIRAYRNHGIEVEGVFLVDLRMRLPSGPPFRFRTRAPVTGITNVRRWAEAAEREVLALAGQGLGEREIRARLLGKTTADGPVIPTLAAFWAGYEEKHLRAEGRKPSSIAAADTIRRLHLDPALGSTRLDEITEESVGALKAAMLGRGLSPKTVGNVCILLASMLSRAVAWGIIVKAPTIRAKKGAPPPPRFYTFEERDRLVAAAREIDTRTLLLALLGVDAGLRRGEMIALEWRDVDTDRRVLHVRRSVWRGEVGLPKSGKEREVPLTAELAAALRAARRALGGVGERVVALGAALATRSAAPVLTTDDGGPASASNLATWISHAQARAGIADAGSLHVLRHTYASHLVMRGASIVAVKELLGHADVKVTMRYAHLAPGATASAVALLDKRPSETVAASVAAGSAASGNAKETR